MCKIYYEGQIILKHGLKLPHIPQGVCFYLDLSFHLITYFLVLCFK